MARITQIQVRRDTAINWYNTNPTLAAGEIGFETNTGKFKIGDGTSLWGALTYATDGSKLTGAIAANTLATSRNINGVAFNGSANITVTAAPTAGTVTDDSIQSTLSPSKITGTASTVAAQRAKFYQGATTLDVPARQFVTGSVAVSNDITRGFLFTPEQDITVIKISNYVVGAASWGTATSPQAKVALYSVSGTTFTPITISDWQASPFGTATSLYEFTIASTGLTAGTTYAVGMLTTWSGTAPNTIPTIGYSAIVGGILAGSTIPPQMNFSLNSQNNITSSAIIAPSATNTPPYFRLA